MKRNVWTFFCICLTFTSFAFYGCGGGDGGTTQISITTSSLPGATVGTAYSLTLAASGGSGTLTWSVTAGSLPAGLTLSSAGVISGTPSAAGTATFTVTVTDSSNPPNSASFQFTLHVSAMSITTASLPAATVGIAYSQTLAVTGGTSPYTWSVSVGALPAGLNLNSATGVISGTPTTAGTSTFTVSVTDSSATVNTATAQLSITVNAMTITTTSLPAATVGTAYSQTLAVAGGTSPYTWTVTVGTLPAGLSLAPASGIISGTPTTAGTSAFTVTVTDAAARTATQNLSITVNAGGAVTITTTTLPAANFGTVYSQTLAASGGTTPYTWTITAGSLPLNMTLSTAGVISGTPLASGTFNITVRVTDAAAATAIQNLSLTVNISATVAAGKTVYDGNCSGCHSLGIYDTTGSPNLSGASGLVSGRFSGGINHHGVTLTPTQITDVTNFISLF